MSLDLVDQRYGSLVVLSKADPVFSGNKYRTRWLCRCDCGCDHIALTENLRAGYTKSCGCKVYTTPRDYTGLRFGRLTVVCRTDLVRDNKNTYWVCRCDCGNVITVGRPSLRSGDTKSCGCLVHTKDGDPRLANINGVFKNYAQKAACRGLEWKLNRDQAIALFESRCVYDGRAPSNVSRSSNKRHPFYYNGLDRVDNKKGYTIENVVPACWMCNRAKGKMSHSQFIEWLVNAGQYQASQLH